MYPLLTQKEHSSFRFNILLHLLSAVDSGKQIQPVVFGQSKLCGGAATAGVFYLLLEVGYFDGHDQLFENGEMHQKDHSKRGDATKHQVKA